MEFVSLLPEVWLLQLGLHSEGRLANLPSLEILGKLSLLQVPYLPLAFSVLAFVLKVI